MPSTDLTVYTIGHSDHTVEDLIGLMRRYGIQVVVDVRSQPYSRWAHQFNRELLSRDLELAGVGYHYMGNLLGGRPADPSLYDPGEEHPNYQLVERTAEYQAGIEDLLRLSQDASVVIMCSEGDHRHCHRHLLITQTLLGRGVQVLHIQSDGTTIQGTEIPRQLALFE